MAHTSGNPTWIDYPSLDTFVTAETLENIEGALDTRPRGVVGRRTRTSNATSSTTQAPPPAGTIAGETMVLWAEAAVQVGRLYRIIAPNMGVYSNVNNAYAQANLRYTTDGAVPDKTSTQLAQSVMPLPGAFVGYAFDVTGLYAPSADLTLRVGLSYLGGVPGGGSVTVTMQGSATFPIVVTIEDVGPDPGSSGADL